MTKGEVSFLSVLFDLSRGEPSIVAAAAQVQRGEPQTGCTSWRRKHKWRASTIVRKVAAHPEDEAHVICVRCGEYRIWERPRV